MQWLLPLMLSLARKGIRWRHLQTGAWSERAEATKDKLLSRTDLCQNMNNIMVLTIGSYQLDILAVRDTSILQR